MTVHMGGQKELDRQLQRVKEMSALRLPLQIWRRSLHNAPLILRRLPKYPWWWPEAGNSVTGV